MKRTSEAFMYRCTYYKSVYIKYITVYRLIYKPLIIYRVMLPAYVFENGGLDRDD